MLKMCLNIRPTHIQCEITVDLTFEMDKKCWFKRKFRCITALLKDQTQPWVKFIHTKERKKIAKFVHHFRDHIAIYALDVQRN